MFAGRPIPQVVITSYVRFLHAPATIDISDSQKYKLVTTSQPTCIGSNKGLNTRNENNRRLHCDTDEIVSPWGETPAGLCNNIAVSSYSRVNVWRQIPKAVIEIGWNDIYSSTSLGSCSSQNFLYSSQPCVTNSSGHVIGANGLPVFSKRASFCAVSGLVLLIL